MSSNSLVSFAAALFGGAVAAAVLLRKQRSIPSWLFFAGMAALAAESAFGGLTLEATDADEAVFWQSLVLGAQSLLPAIWLAFSLSYSRGNAREFLMRWRLVLALALLVPVGIAIGFRSELIEVLPQSAGNEATLLRFGSAGKAINILLLLASVVILMNLEKTFRSTAGTMRWKIKFVVLGLGVVFGARIYTVSQALLFSGHDLSLASVEAGALLIGCVLFVVAYLRNGFAGIDVYPSHAVLQSSVTVLLAGAYLFIVGALAQIVAVFGGAENFQAQALVVLVGIAVLAVLLFSDRLRQTLHRFVSRHFRRPQHDVRKVWTLFTRRMSNVLNRTDLCTVAAKLVSETFNVLSVTIWLFDEQKRRLVLGASTSRIEHEDSDSEAAVTVAEIVPALQRDAEPFDLEKVQAGWAEGLKELSPIQFQKGGHRWCVPLVAGEKCLGVGILADRVNGIPYSTEEKDLLKCIGDQVAAALLKLQLTEEVMAAKELEAFQTISTFFVHDMKNAAFSLSLMLQNLPVHFNEPAFREDALRGISKTVERINHLIERLSVLRHKLELRPMEIDLNQLVSEMLGTFNALPGVELVKEFQASPKIVGDRELVQSVVTNLLLNAQDAVGTGGLITVRTDQRDGRVILSVVDNGCGMSRDFVRQSLFRPFQTTKNKGLGIGMFQSKMIVEAHRGTIQVESEPGKGTTFRVSLPPLSQTP